VQEQERECRPLSWAAQADRAVVADRFERPEDPELEHAGDGNASIADG
jgi:hypothetical protein